MVVVSGADLRARDAGRPRREFGFAGGCVWVLSPEWRALVVALVMAVLSPVMAEIGKHVEAPTVEEGSDE